MSKPQAFTVCVTARSGLGHLRRVTNIAGALKALLPDAKIVLLINAPPSCLSDEDLALFSQINVMPRQEMARFIPGLQSGPVIVDTAVIPCIECLPNPLCLILRETIREKLPAFRLPGGRMWDRVLVPAPRDEWSAGAGVLGARLVENVGWIYRPTERTHSTPVLRRADDKPTLLIASGGGGADDCARRLCGEIDHVVAQLRDQMNGALRVVQAVGPRTSALLSECDEATSFADALNIAFAQADLVISTVGYNSVLELAGCTTPVLLTPIERTYDDQLARARRWQKALGRLHRGSETQQTVTWMRKILEGRLRRARIDIGPSGAAAAAEVLAACLRIGPEVGMGGLYRKTQLATVVPTPSSVARWSRKLFAAGVNTLPGREDIDSHSINFARAEGPTARTIMERTGGTMSPAALARHETLLAKILETLAGLHHVNRDSLGLGLPDNGPQGQGGAEMGPMGLRPLDPWRRIVGRLQQHRAARDAAKAWLPTVQRLVDRQEQLLCANGGRQDAASRIVHGDFHCGQLIQPAGSSEFLLIDLDDLAMGPVESDIANFAAHFVTTPALFRGPLPAGFAAMAGMCADLYARLAPGSLNTDLVDQYGSIALLRRFLKLVERNGSSDGLHDLLTTAQALISPPVAAERTRVASEQINDRQSVTTSSSEQRIERIQG